MGNLAFKDVGEEEFLPKEILPDITVKPDADTWEACVYHNPHNLEASWRKLEAQGACTVFQTYDWASCWYEAAAACAQAEPLIVTVARKDAGIVWLLPLCLYRKGKLKIITFADLGLSNYTGPVAAPHALSDPESVRGIAAAILESLPECDLIHFQKLPEKIGTIANPLLQLPGIQRFRADCYGIALDEPWQALKKKFMGSSDRSNIRRRAKLLKKEGAVVLTHHMAAAEKTELTAKLIAMQNKRFEATGRPAMPAFWQEFYRILALRGQSSSFKSCISTIAVSGEVIAMSLGVVRNNSYLGILATSAVDRWQRFGPGILLCDALLEDFQNLTKSRTGYFDFSTGDHDYKLKFGCEKNPLYEYMKPRSIRGAAPYLISRVKAYLWKYPRVFELLRSGRKMRFFWGVKGK